MRFKLATRGSIVRLAILLGLLGITLCVCSCLMLSMPGKSYSGALPPPTETERSLADSIATDIEELAGRCGPRNRVYRANYFAAAEYIEGRLRAAGLQPRRLPSPPADPKLTPGTIVVEIPGSAEASKILVVGAHYDSFDDAPGANDNASGVAAVLALADRLGRDPAPARRTLRLAFFVDEEPPYFQSDEMGSLVYARLCRANGDDIMGMISVETIGCYSDEPGSQKYPAPFSLLYPDTGNFVGFVSNYGSRALLRSVIATFRDTTRFPSEGAAPPGFIPGVSWSDQWSFWQAGYPALMMTDTAPFRYRWYHTINDTPDKVDLEKMSRVTAGLERIVRSILGPAATAGSGSAER